MPRKPQLTDEQIAEIQRRSADGASQRALAAEFDISQSVIAKALARTKAEPGPPAPPAEAAEIVRIPLRQLMPSPLNPRRSFDDDSLVELADSIQANGVLQNLVVRRLAGVAASLDGMFEIIAGERRYRAALLLVGNGVWDADATLPCRVIDADDGTHLALALLENLQRETLPVLEEAEAFDRLQKIDPAQWTTAAIAERIGRTQRYVQQRLAIAGNLIAPARTLLRHGKLTVEGARLLAARTEDQQIDILEDHYVELAGLDDEVAGDEAFEPIDAASIRRAIDYIERQAGWQVQQAEAADGDDRPASSLPLDAAWIDAGAPETAAPAAEAKPQGPAWTKGHIYHAHKRKAAALQEAVADNHAMALCIACMALLARQETIQIGANPHWISCVDDEQPELLILSTRITRILSKTKPPEFSNDTKAQLALWKRLRALSNMDLCDLFDALVARQVRNPAGHQCRLGDAPLALAIAESLGLPGDEAAHGLALAEDDITGLRKSALLHVADQSATPAVNDGMKAGEIGEAIARHHKDHGYVVPTLRFGDDAAIEKAWIDG